MSMSTSQRLNDLRARVAAGEEVSDEEYTEIIAALRAERMTAAQPRGKAAPKSTAKPIDLGELFT